jgi:hypothetical protein
MAMDVLPAGNIRFVGEQEGAVERELKDRLAKLFEVNKHVLRAYLANVDYQDVTPIGVALCLHSTTGEDLDLVQQIRTIFAAMFNSDQHLDVLFLSQMQEERLKEVCSPFYISG